MTTGERIRSRRKELGLTQEELGQRIGLKKAAISKFEKDIVINLKRSTIAALARALECPASYLMGFDSPDESPDTSNPLPDPRTEELLDLFSRLTDAQKDFILAAIHGLLSG